VYTNSRSAAHAYANVGLETGVVAASPQRLIVMLYEGAELAVRMAIKHIKEGDIARKSAAITKASTIILEGLRAALDPQQGGEIAQQLAEGPPLLFPAIKQLLRHTEMVPEHEAFELHDSLHLVQQVVRSEDLKEGTRAFTEKRKPRWTGR